MKLFIMIFVMLLSVVATENSSAHGSLESEAEREQIKQMSEEERLLSYFTDNANLSVQIYASAVYNEKDFEKRFGNIDDLSDSEKERVYETILNEIQESEISTCQYVTKGLGVLFNSTHKLVCADVKDVTSSITSMKTYKGLSCHCSYETSSGEVFYMKKYPPPTKECLRFASTEEADVKCLYRSPPEPFANQFQTTSTSEKLKPSFWKWRSLCAPNCLY